MRFRHINLLRYGKFTDFPIDLPKPDEDNEPDFHLIVGANEAGKSTTRHAITDLLFGIETRTRFDFLHDKKDMRLGAVLENDTAEIEYHRLKRKQPLFNPDDTLLPDDALAAYTGNANRTSFEREFCLDHKRLEAGGKSILDSKDDVGRMLFEASTGVDIYGKIISIQVDEETNALWSSRYSKDREYYKAHDAFKEAQRTLKEATARTTEWKATNQKVVEASEALAAATKAYQALEQTRRTVSTAFAVSHRIFKHSRRQPQDSKTSGRLSPYRKSLPQICTQQRVTLQTPTRRPSSIKL